MKKADVNDVRKAVYHYRGSRVVVRANKGRHRFDVNEGVIKEVYPYIFMIEVDAGKEGDGNRTISYSYNDLLTQDVKMTLCAAD
ncbi:MAG: Veg family protein [Catonella sp.]|nr:Veg family protein [Catonella sp.]